MIELLNRNQTYFSKTWVLKKGKIYFYVNDMGGMTSASTFCFRSYEKFKILLNTKNNLKNAPQHFHILFKQKRRNRWVVHFALPHFPHLYRTARSSYTLPEGRVRDIKGSSLKMINFVNRMSSLHNTFKSFWYQGLRSKRKSWFEAHSSSEPNKMLTSKLGVKNGTLEPWHDVKRRADTWSHPVHLRGIHC